ncbi:hypothetical protein MHYP_G00005270 [Metynnis hypsauchen]
MYNLLSPLCTTSANIIIIGDINIHVNNPSCRFAAEFLQMLDCFSLRQLVDVPTHSRGHTLDLVITDSAPVRNLSVYDLGVSDHRVVSMELPILSLSMKPKRQICFRNLKRINPEIMTIDLKNLLHTDLPSVNDAVDFYNKTLSSILDLHAPVKTRTVTFSRSAPWFTDELREMKAAGRALERCYKASGLTVHNLFTVNIIFTTYCLSRRYSGVDETQLPPIEQCQNRGNHNWHPTSDSVNLHNQYYILQPQHSTLLISLQSWCEV